MRDHILIVDDPLSPESRDRLTEAIIAAGATGTVELSAAGKSVKVEVKHRPHVNVGLIGHTARPITASMLSALALRKPDQAVMVLELEKDYPILPVDLEPVPTRDETRSHFQRMADAAARRRRRKNRR